ncbi:ABC transporter ATP-binding protein, partial [Rhizobium johnstonii]
PVGRVPINGRDPSAKKTAATAASFIFQSPQTPIILPIVQDDIAFGLTRRGFPQAEIEAKVEGLLARFGAEALADRRAHELSGGEGQ